MDKLKDITTVVSFIFSTISLIVGILIVIGKYPFEKSKIKEEGEREHLEGESIVPKTYLSYEEVIARTRSRAAEAEDREQKTKENLVQQINKLELRVEAVENLNNIYLRFIKEILYGSSRLQAQMKSLDIVPVWKPGDIPPEIVEKLKELGE